MKKIFVVLALASVSTSFFIFPHNQVKALIYQSGQVLGDSTASTISISPNPVQICDGSTATTVTVTANAPVNYDIRINSATGDLFAQQAANTQTIKQTGNWVTNGMVFDIVDTNAGTVLASAAVTFTSAGCASPIQSSITLNPNPIRTCFGNTATTTISATANVNFEIHTNSPTGDLFSKQAANSQLTQTTGNWVTNGMLFYLVDSDTQAVLGTATATVTSINCTFPNQPSAINNIKSVTWYEFGPTYAQSLSDLQQQIPRIKQAGFNAVWLVTPWAELNPQPLANPPVYNDASFTALKQTLDVLRANGMQALIGLDYLGQGWAPQGIDYCSWITVPAQYQAFVNYASEFLNRLNGYQDVANIMVFTENAEPCNLNAYSNATQIANDLNSALGNLPNQLPAALRAKFRIGYHDYDLLNLGWAQGTSPIASPNSFDFVSMVAYDLESKTNDQITAEINLRASRFKALYPNTPLIIGEFGARSCSSDQDTNQARVDSAILQTAESNNYGFNLWGWQPAAANECAQQLSGYGYAITNIDGSPKPAALAIAGLLDGNISSLPTSGSTSTPPAGSQTASSTAATNTTASSTIPTNTTIAASSTSPSLPIPLTGLAMPPVSPIMNQTSLPYPTGDLVNDGGTIYFIRGGIKIPFTNWQAFVGLGYSLRNVIKGDLTNYSMAQGYVISTSQAAHPWGTWLLYKGTIFSSSQTGLIGVPSYPILLENGGNLKFVIRANKYDIANISSSNSSVVTFDDSRIYR